METNNTMNARMTHPPKQKRIRNTASSFSKQEVHLSDTPLFLPDGYENIFIALYFLSLPYIAGLMFQFFYVCGMKVDIFLALYEQSSSILIWVIGYEILATLILLYIVKLSLSFSKNNMKNNTHTFRRP